MYSKQYIGCILFTFGSLCFVVQSFLLTIAELSFSNLLYLIGSIVFLIGSYLFLLEAIETSNNK